MHCWVYYRKFSLLASYMRRGRIDIYFWEPAEIRFHLSSALLVIEDTFLLIDFLTKCVFL